jgi:hypothetical protein
MPYKNKSMEYITATKYYIDYLAVLFDYIYYKIWRVWQSSGYGKTAPEL